jgi:hypothetical protein
MRPTTATNAAIGRRPRSGRVHTPHPVHSMGTNTHTWVLLHMQMMCVHSHRQRFSSEVVPPRGLARFALAARYR